jgi:FkbM family methyltransferase
MSESIKEESVRMTNPAISNGAGMDVVLPDLRRTGRFALAILFRLPLNVRDSIIFGRSPICVRLQKVIVRLLGGTYAVATKFTEGPMRGQSFFCFTAEKYFYLGSHLEDDAQQMLLESLRPGDVCYDIGGHAGYMALLFAAIVGSTGRVYSFEPSAANFLRVQCNIDANRSKNTTVLNLAASNHEGEAVLEERGTMSSIVSTPRQSNGVSTIRTIRLDDFAYRDNNPVPNFIKIDVEGHAGPALEGMKRILEEARPKIICELHSIDEEEQVTRIMSCHSYQMTAIDQQRKFPRRVMICPA